MALEKKLMSKKKPTFPINKMLDEYLKKYNRNLKISIFYDDLLRFQGSVIQSISNQNFRILQTFDRILGRLLGSQYRNLN